MMNSNKVTVIPVDENDNLIAVSQNNPEYGHIRVEQTVAQFDAKGWLRNTRRTALIHGLVTDLESFNFKKGQTLAGNIVVRESLTPFDNENPDRDYKIAGETGVICRVDDQPIYRKTFFTPNQNESDELIQHTNADEIREVREATLALHELRKTQPIDEEVTL